MSDITPLAISESSKKTNLYSLDYTNQCYWSLKSRALEIARQKFDHDFNDFAEPSLAVMLIELYSFIGDSLSFKIDQIANEVFIDTVSEPINAFRLSRLMGFKPNPPVPSRAMYIVSMNHPLSIDIEIGTPFVVPLNTSVGQRTVELFPADANDNPVYNEPIIIPAGSLSNKSVVGLEGRTEYRKMVGTGMPNQIVELKGPVLWQSVSVTVDGMPWEEVNFFSESKQLREYRLEYNANYSTFVVFGNRYAGMIPSTGNKIEVRYRIGGGIVGNYITGAVKTRSNISVKGSSSPLSIGITNYTKGEFGYNGDSVEDIRRKLPAYLHSQNRCVSDKDLKTFASTFATPYNGMIGKANAVLRNSGCAGNIIDLYILALNGDDNLTVANDNLKEALAEKLGEKQMFTDFICIKDGGIINVDVHIDISMNKSNRKLEDQVRERVTNRLVLFFKLANWDFGQMLRDSDIIKILADISEADHIDVSFVTEESLENEGATSVVSPSYREIIRLDNIEISFNYTK